VKDSRRRGDAHEASISLKGPREFINEKRVIPENYAEKKRGYFFVIKRGELKGKDWRDA